VTLKRENAEWPGNSEEHARSALDRCEVILFDLDGTLYCAADYPEFVAHMDEVTGSRLRGAYQADSDRDAFEALVLEQRRLGFRSKSDALATLFGFDLASMNRYREERTQPERFLRSDPALVALLGEMSHSYRLILGTNSTEKLAQRILRVLGLPAGLFELIIDSEEAGVAKPDVGFFRYLLGRCPVAPDRWLSVGDRPEADLIPALKLGMSAWHAQSTRDLRQLWECRQARR
jgi:FMN phosphatase YigB (HAD superfamily)